MTRDELLKFMRRHRLVVEASVSAQGTPQAAVVGAIVTDRLEVFFDTLGSTRKVQNVRRGSKVALVVGGMVDGEEETVQYEGIADEPKGAELDRLKAEYFVAFPDGVARQAWPGLTYIRVKPVWIRYSDFRPESRRVIEFNAEDLAG
jgi:general stress protein 26